MKPKFNPALRAVTMLASGTAAAQLISVVAMPVITRLYTPEDYGLLGLYSSFVVVAGGVAGLKFDAAVILPSPGAEGDRASVALFLISVASVVGISGLLLVAILCWLWIVGPEGAFGWWALLLPLGTAAGGLALSLSALATRAGEFALLSRVSPVQKIVSVTAQMAGGLVGVGAVGLLVGALLQPITAIGLLMKGRSGKMIRPASPVGGRELRDTAGQYRDFPFINAPTALLNLLAWNSQIMLLALYYDREELGMYSLAMAIVGLPLTILLSAVSQVYLRESARRKDDPRDARRLWTRLLLGLLSLSVPLFIGLVLASQFLVAPLFGSEWMPAGLIAIALLPALWGRFMTTTVSTTFVVYRRQIWMLVWQVIALAVASAGYVIGGAMALPIEETVAFASWLTLPVYLAVIPLSALAMRAPHARMCREP